MGAKSSKGQPLTTDTPAGATVEQPAPSSDGNPPPLNDSARPTDEVLLFTVEDAPAPEALAAGEASSLLPHKSQHLVLTPQASLRSTDAPAPPPLAPLPAANAPLPLPSPNDPDDDNDDAEVLLLLDELERDATGPSVSGPSATSALKPTSASSPFPPTPAVRKKSVVEALEELLEDKPSTATPTPSTAARTVHFIHFNDVYEVQESDKEPVGGAARFLSAVKQFSSHNPIVVFGGDAFFPSLYSTVLKGRQMVRVLNEIGVDVAVVGNHEFDMGLDLARKLVEETRFPWLLSNILDQRTSKPLLGAGAKHVIERNGVKVGFAGCVEDWTETLGCIDEDDVCYVDLFEDIRRVSAELKAEGCDLVIGLTHNRMPNDYAILETCPDVDLVLGGHDHHYEAAERDGKWAFNSGSDFKNLTFLSVTLPPKGQPGRPAVTHQRVDVTRAIEPDPSMEAMVKEFEAQVGSKMGKVIGEFACDLETRFSRVRTSETNAGNLLADALRFYARGDIAILNSGSIRSDKVLPAGEFTLRDLNAMLPSMDETCVVALTGRQVVVALENAVSKYPQFDGRFPQVSGLKFAFDPSLSPGSRIPVDSVRVLSSSRRAAIGTEADERDYTPIDLDATYKVATKAYVASGRDGFDVFTEGRVIIEPGEAQPLPLAFRNVFTAVEVLNQLKVAEKSASEWALAEMAASAWRRKAGGEESYRARLKNLTHGIVYEKERGKYLLNPAVEGRIVNLNPDPALE